MSYFMMSSMMAAAVYAAQEKIRSIGRSDREDYLDERLSWDAIAKAAFARSGYSSILPMMLDSPPFSTMTGGGIFDYRSSGQPSTGWTSNPTVSLLDDFQRGSRGIVAPIFEGRPITQQEARSITRVVPLGNTLPAVLGLNGLISGLDERPPRQYRD